MELALEHAFASPWGGPARPLAVTREKVTGAERAAHGDLDAFLAEVGPRALVMARVAVRDPDEAMDLVQDAMCKLVAKYGHKPAAEWRPLFFRILQSRIRDWYRRRAVRVRLRVWLGGPRDGVRDETAGDPLDEIADPRAPAPSDGIARERAGQALREALAGLPARQQQAFLLRAWEELDVAATARAMGCSEGSVKTHYFRAVRALRVVLEAYRP